MFSFKYICSSFKIIPSKNNFNWNCPSYFKYIFPIESTSFNLGIGNILPFSIAKP